MFTKIMKVVCVGALILMAFWEASAGAVIVLDILVCVGAMTVATQAFARPKYIWTVGFLVIALFFNPVVPVALSRSIFLLLDVACLLAFLLSLEALKTQPVLTIPSITNRRPRSESL
ncbi:MAG TPA: DUF6804 family protein [Terriglobia bacterium]|nr:DUF6804 family protein [Terriglobia bacterium]